MVVFTGYLDQKYTFVSNMDSLDNMAVEVSQKLHLLQRKFDWYPSLRHEARAQH